LPLQGSSGLGPGGLPPLSASSLALVNSGRISFIAQQAVAMKILAFRISDSDTDLPEMAPLLMGIATPTQDLQSKSGGVHP